MMLEEWATMDKWCTPLMLLLALNFMILTILLASRSSNDKGNGKKQKLERSPFMLPRLIDMSQFAGFNNNVSNNATQQLLHVIDSEVDNQDKKIQAAEGAFNERHGQQTSATTMQSSSSRSAFRNFREAELAAFVKYPPIILEDEQVAEAEVEAEVETDRSIEEVFSQLQRQVSHMKKAKSDSEPASGAIPVKLVQKIKKSSSSKSAFSHFKEAEIVEARRPSTVKEAKVKYSNDEDDEEVDSKADDFIIMFKQQLKLQRLDSILSYKEMLDRGASRP